MEVRPALKTHLKRLKLSGILATLPDRVAYARKTKLPELDFLELVLQDEVDRRDHKNLALRLDKAGFEEDAPVTFDRDRVRDLFSLGFLERHEDVIFVGPVGVGKTFLASALGHSACRAGARVLFLRADRMFQQLHQSRADYSRDKTLRRLLAPDLLILDDFGLRRLTSDQSSDLYEVILERHRRASTIVTSNRAIEEWIPTTPTSSSWRARATASANDPANRASKARNPGPGHAHGGRPEPARAMNQSSRGLGSRS
jgi:DNA replication protein DnaC